MVLLGMLYQFRARILTAAGQFLVEDDGAQKADCILVLGGDEFGTRIIRAAQLAQAGYAPYVIVDGPKALIGHESDITIEYAVQAGYPSQLFRPELLPTGMDSTNAEAVYVADTLLKPNHIKKILLVTSNYHTRRAARFIRKAAPWLEVAVIPAPDPYFTPDGWWKSRSGRKTFLYEWLKTISERWGS